MNKELTISEAIEKLIKIFNEEGNLKLSGISDFSVENVNESHKVIIH